MRQDGIPVVRHGPHQQRVELIGWYVGNARPPDAPVTCWKIFIRRPSDMLPDPSVDRAMTATDLKLHHALVRFITVHFPPRPIERAIVIEEAPDDLWEQVDWERVE